MLCMFLCICNFLQCCILFLHIRYVFFISVVFFLRGHCVTAVETRKFVLYWFIRPWVDLYSLILNKMRSLLTFQKSDSDFAKNLTSSVLFV